MSITRIFSLIIASNFRIIRKRISGNHIRAHYLSLIHKNVDLLAHGSDSNIRLGYKCQIKRNTEINANGGSVIIDNDCFINSNCLIAAHERIHIGERTTIGPGTYIYDHDHDGNGGYDTSPVTIGKNVWIGAGCIILKGVKIGDNSVIGAGTLVTKDVPSNVITYQKRDTHCINKAF